MKLEEKHELLQKHKANALVIGMFKDKVPSELKALDCYDLLSDMIRSKEFSADFGEMKILTFKGSLKKVLVVGLGEDKDFTLEKLRRISGRCVKRMIAERILSFSSVLHSVRFNASPIDKAVAVAEGFMLGSYRFNKHITVDKDKLPKVSMITFLDNSKEVAKAVRKAFIVSRNVNLVRDLVNESAEIVTPEFLASEAKKLAKLSRSIKVKVFGRKEIVKLGMGGIEAVSRGGGREPKFIIIDYAPSKETPIVIVGKGITFDSGGLNLKPYQYMENMQSDEAGASTVIGLIKTLAELGIKKHVIGVIPACENMLGPRAYKQGDVIKAFNGKTIEIWHTDAEGRLILADALSYAEKVFKPKAIIDIATLTGASIIALGYDITSLVGSDPDLKKDLLNASEFTGEAMWELPLYDDYNEHIKGDIGDIRNASKESVGPGVITAALFLKNFVDKTPWAHLDIGATVWTKYDKDYRQKGATGVMLRTLLKFLEG